MNILWAFCSRPACSCPTYWCACPPFLPVKCDGLISPQPPLYPSHEPCSQGGLACFHPSWNPIPCIRANLSTHAHPSLASCESRLPGQGLQAHLFQLVILSPQATFFLSRFSPFTLLACISQRASVTLCSRLTISQWPGGNEVRLFAVSICSKPINRMLTRESLPQPGCRNCDQPYSRQW